MDCEDTVVSAAALKSELVDILNRIDERRYPDLLRLTRLIRGRQPKPGTGPLVLAARASEPLPSPGAD
jgi:hypothetical protein